MIIIPDIIEGLLLLSDDSDCNSNLSRISCESNNIKECSKHTW